MIDETGKTIYYYKPGLLERVIYFPFKVWANIDAAYWKKRYYKG